MGDETLSGAWGRAASVALAPMYSSWTVASSRHSDDEPVDVRQANTIEAPPLQPTGPGAELAPPSGLEGRGRIDNTPQAHAGVPMHPGMTLDESYRVHSERLGADVRETVDLPRVLFWNESYPVTLTRDMDAPPAARGAADRPDLTRGLNAFAANNPGKEMYGGEGWRRAIWQRPATVHRLRLPERRHRFRVITQWAAKTDADTPGERGTVYAVPWSSLARFVPRDFSRPRMRRTPPQIDEAVKSDGLEGGLRAADVGGWV